MKRIILALFLVGVLFGLTADTAEASPVIRQLNWLTIGWQGAQAASWGAWFTTAPIVFRLR